MEGLLEEIMKSVMQQQSKKTSTKPSTPSQDESSCKQSLNIGDILGSISNGDFGGINGLVDQLKDSPLAELVQVLEKDFGLDACKDESCPQKKVRDNVSPSKSQRTVTPANPVSSLIGSIPQDIRVSFPVDIREMETSFIVYAEIPGADKSSIILEIENDALVIIATKISYPLGSDEFHCVERSKGVYTRSVKLPTTVDTRNISLAVAKYTDGVLSVKMPKCNNVPESSSRRILVQ